MIFLKTQGFSAKLKDFLQKLKVSEISGTCTAAESAKKTLYYALEEKDVHFGKTPPSPLVRTSFMDGP